ncbi:hypothetical protein [Joostella sp. CR20]|uniref:hypothetical protein n=1 Tax=Joostella sp. CR20 TaxID=2804312 RepID=UPI00313CC084
MEKIIENLIIGLTEQRAGLVDRIKNTDANSINFLNEKQIIEEQISCIDNQIENHLNKITSK